MTLHDAEERSPPGNTLPTMTVRAKRCFVVGSFLGLGLIAAFVWWSRARKPIEPTHAGRPLSYWVQRLHSGTTNIAASHKALRAMAPEAAQYFFDSIDTNPGDTLLQETYRSLWKRFPYRLRRRAPTPPEPELTRMHNIAGYLTLIGPEAHETILAACKHPNRKVRYTAVLATPYIGRWRGEAVPVVAGLLSDPDPAVREKAIAALARIEADKSTAFDALLVVIKSNQQIFAEHSLAKAATTLGEIGPAAIEAVPRLTKFMSSSNTVLRVESAIALWKIDRDTNALACLISEILNPESEKDILWTMIPALGAMGPGAQPFVPALEQKLSSANDTNSPAWLPTSIHKALNRITSTNRPRLSTGPLHRSEF